MVASLSCFPFESNTLMRCRHPQFGESPDRLAELSRTRPGIIAFYLLSKYRVKTVFCTPRNSYTFPPRNQPPWSGPTRAFTEYGIHPYFLLLSPDRKHFARPLGCSS
jgi:hypothetical protein